MEVDLLEAALLEDLRKHTDLSFRRIGGIDTRDAKIAQAVLPVAASWVGKLGQDLNYRRATYALFNTRHAHAYVDQVIRWWAVEKDEIALGFLTQALASLVKAENASKIWEACKALPRRPFYFLLLAKLASQRMVAKDVKAQLLLALDSEPLSGGDLAYIAQVNDPSIKEWFKGHSGSPNSILRGIAAKVGRTSSRLPRGVTRSNLAPDRTTEVFSTESDLSRVPQVLAVIEKTYEMSIPAGVRIGTFLGLGRIDEWLVSEVSSSSGAATLWFRLEDVDTVEILLLAKNKTQLPN